MAKCRPRGGPTPDGTESRWSTRSPRSRIGCSDEGHTVTIYAFTAVHPSRGLAGPGYRGRSLMTAPVSARGWASSPRLLAGWALVGYAGGYLVFAFFDWVLPGDGTFTGRSSGAAFTSLTIMAMPVIAVLLA